MAFVEKNYNLIPLTLFAANFLHTNIIFSDDHQYQKECQESAFYLSPF